MKSPNVKIIAKACGLSPSTVCRVLNKRPNVSEKAKSKVLNACRKFGYTKNMAASSLRTQKSNIITAIMPEFSNELFIEKLYFLKREVSALNFNWNINFYSDGKEAENIFYEVISRRPAGIITSYKMNSEILKLLSGHNIPIAGFDMRHPQIDHVVLNREQGIYEAVSYLIKRRGKTKILFIGIEQDSERGRGYIRAYKDCHIQFDNTLLIDIPFGRNLFTYGYTQMQSCFGKIQFDAVCAVNDACAIGVIKALSEKGISVPDDIPVIGFDNIMASQYTVPSLTTVAQPKEEMAEYCVRFLIKRMNNPDIPLQKITLNTFLILRQSA